VSSEQDEQFFDTMGGEFDARLKRNTITTRTSKSDGRELTVSNPLAIVEARFSYKVLDRLYFPSFVAIERNVDGKNRHIVFEVVGVSPTHYQLSGIDSSMPTLLRKEYLDTIKESWGKSQETWIDLAAIPTNYMLNRDSGELVFSRTPYAPLPGAQVFLLSKEAVEQFLCVADGENIGRMAGFDLPFTVDMDSLIRFHCAFFGFSLDYAEPITYREGTRIKIGKIGELVDQYFAANEDGRRYTDSIEVLSFDPVTLQVSWSPIQYVFRHRFSGKLLRFHARTGRTVTVTRGHSLFVLREGEVQCVPSDQLHPGDLLAGSRTVPTTASDPVEIDVLSICERSQAKGIRMVGIGKAAFRSVSLPSSWRSWYWRQKRYLPASYFPNLSRDAVGHLRLGYKNCRHTIPQLLTIDVDLARLLGYYTAEGHVVVNPGKHYAVQFTLHKYKDIGLARDIRAILHRKFGITPIVSRHGSNAIRLTFSNKILAYLFRELVGERAVRKRVPEAVLNSPRPIRDAFIQAWAAGDYLVTTSEGLMNDILCLLLMDNTVGTVSEWEGEGEVVIEGRTVSASPRFQMPFPSAEEVRDGTARSRRGRAEPIFPVRAMPAAAKSLLRKPSSVAKSNSRLSGRTLADMVRRMEGLNSHVGAENLSLKDARHDGVYRQGFRRHLVVNDGIVSATQLLTDATRQLHRAVQLAESNLTFYEVERVEEVDPTSQFVYDVSVPGLENFLAGFGGVFCHNTGSGKSNLASLLIRLAMTHDPDLTVVVMDIAGEYGVNLLDLLRNDARVISTEWFDSVEEFSTSQAVPETMEENGGRKAIESALSRIYAKGIERLSLQEGGGLDLAWIQNLLENAVESGKPGGTAAKMALGTLTTEFYEKKRLKPSTRLSDLDQSVASELSALLTEVHTNVHQMSALVKDIDLIVKQLETGNFGVSETSKLSPERLAEQLAKGTAPRLNVIYAPEPTDARQTVQRLIGRLLFLKKKFGNRQRVLIVLDEAQEYIPDEHTPKDYTTQSNRAVEQLLRQGRKYRLHCWMATQRVARLNVNALQQLHSYFVSTLPRMYDRMVIADAFALPYEVLERSADLGTGEWLFVSFKAAKQRNVPVFLKTENNESFVAHALK